MLRQHRDKAFASNVAPRRLCGFAAAQAHFSKVNVTDLRHAHDGYRGTCRSLRCPSKGRP